MSNIELYWGDCLKIMDGLIADGVKVDAVITSPPYNMNLRVLNGKYISRCKNKNHDKEFSTKYINYSDDLSMNDYFNFQKSFLEKCFKISSLIFYNIQMITGNKSALFNLFGYFSDKIKEIIIWDKINSQPAMAEKMLNSQFEFIVIFDKEKPYNRQFDNANFERGTLSNVWQIKRERNKNHKAAFPLELVNKILQNFTNEGDIILDPFMGSGTTGVACKNLNRNFIGIELDLNYYMIAQERINKNPS